jgi:anti-sigma B factor antagonist
MRGGVTVKIKKNWKDDVMVLELSGKVMGGPDYEKFHSEIKGLLQEGVRRFVLDFSGVGWINSTGVGILVGAYQSIRNAEGVLKICSPNERVLSVYYISQLDKVFDLYESCEEALASFGGE